MSKHTPAPWAVDEPRFTVPLGPIRAQRPPLTDDERRALWRASDFRGNGGQIDWFIEGTRAAERAHGIGEPVVRGQE